MFVYRGISREDILLDKRASLFETNKWSVESKLCHTASSEMKRSHSPVRIAFARRQFFPSGKKQLVDLKKYVKRKQYIKYLVVSSQQKLTRLLAVHVICISMQEEIHRFCCLKYIMKVDFSCFNTGLVAKSMLRSWSRRAPTNSKPNHT